LEESDGHITVLISFGDIGETGFRDSERVREEGLSGEAKILRFFCFNTGAGKIGVGRILGAGCIYNAIRVTI
jgi:hypothetical protein